MTEPSFLEVAAARGLAYRHLEGRNPCVLLCGGYTSDMTKALALERGCRAARGAYVRFDYAGHGRVGWPLRGRHDRWLGGRCAGDRRSDRARALIVVGSSMGCWIMLLVALARPERVHALIGIAAAPDWESSTSGTS